MRSNSVLFRAGVAALLLAALALSGCGRKGALEPPPGAAAASQSEDGNAAQSDEPEKPDKRIVLDNLL